MQNLLTLGALGLAAYRGTQLIVNDSILDPLRSRLGAWYAENHKSRWRSFWWDLVGCTYCAGFWVSLVTMATYLTAAGQWGAASPFVHAVEVWTVAGAQALLNRWDSTRGGGS